MKENNMKMSTVDEHIPRYYKGYDMDILLTKLDNNEPLLNEEMNVIGEVQNIYYKKYFDENRKKAEEWKKAHPSEYTKFVDPQRTDKGRSFKNEI